MKPDCPRAVNVCYRAASENVSNIRLTPLGAQASINLAKVTLQVIPVDNDYNPKDYREPKSTILPWMAHFNLLRTVLGPGILGMPVAMSASGLILGNLFTVLIGIIMVHSHHVLLLSLNEISRQLKIPYISYRYGFRVALLHGPPIWHCIGHHGPLIIATHMIMCQLGICTVNVIMTSDSLRDIVDCRSVVPPLLGLLPCFVLMVAYMKNLKRISYISLLATILNTLGLCLLLYHIFKEPDRNWIWFEPSIGGWLFTTGMCMFNFSAVGVIINLDKSLEKPDIMTSKFGVINMGIGIPAVVSLVVGDLGYWAFGTMEENCLRSLPYEDLTTMIAIGMYLVSMALSYPLQCYPGIEMIKEVIKYYGEVPPTEATLNLIEKIARPLFVIVSFFIAYHVPFQGPFVAFVGSLCTSMMSVVFPMMMDISLMYNVPGAYGKYKIYLIKDLVILIFAIICWIFGIYFCAYLIYIRLLSKRSPNVNIYL